MSAEHLLRRAGWTEERRVDVQLTLEQLKAAGYEPWQDLAVMLAEFSFLDVYDPSRSRQLWIDAGKAVGEADPDWLAAYRRHVGHSLVPVGGYSHMSLMYGRDAVFYGGYDRGFGRLGSSIAEVVENLLCITPPVRHPIELSRPWNTLAHAVQVDPNSPPEAQIIGSGSQRVGFLAQFDRSTGDLVTAFVPTTILQLGR